MRKTAVLAFLFAAVVIGLIGCVELTTNEPITTVTTQPTVTTTTTGTTTTTVFVDQAPVISGADDVTIEKNAGFAPLAGVTATDDVDGDITDDIRFTGNVNPNAVGVYTLTYTVTDSYGNITTVERVITVVLTDTQAPIIAGIGNLTIYVGEAFDKLDGVSAIDTIDGEVDVDCDGDVDVWTEGVYTLTYTAEDAAGNDAEQTREITVSYGDFIFGAETVVDDAAFTADGENLTYGPVAGGLINPNIAPFSYVCVQFIGTATTSGTIGIALGSLAGSAVEIAVSATATDVKVIYVILAPISETLTIDTNGLTLDFSVEISFAEIRDLVAPVINLPSDEIAYPINYSLSGLEALLISNVTAVDDIDGNVTSSVSVDLGDLDVAVVGIYTVVYSVTDAGGNEATLERTVIIGNQVDSGLLSDPTFQNLGDGKWREKSNNGDADISYNAAEGTMDILINSLGGWASAAGAYYKESSLIMEAGVWYQFTFTVRTEVARKMMFRMGMALGAAPWYDDFDGNANGHILNLTTDWQTFSFYFTLEDLVGSDGSNLFGIELNLGWVNYENVGVGATTSFKDVYLYKLTTSFEAPTIEQQVGANLPTKLTVGDALPNFADYIIAMDMSRNVLVPTIDASAVNMNAAGSYDVVYSVTDSHDMTTTHTITFQVFTAEQADNVGPVVTIKDGIPTSIDQFTSLNVNLTALVDAIDAVDGAIVVTPAMVDDGGLNFNVAGVYTVTYTVYDQSGNVTVFTQDVTVVDKQAPTITAGDFAINVGDTFDPFKGVSVLDNVDGSITIANVTVEGLDQFMVAGFAANNGTFDITYTVSDALGNIATKTVSVTVTNIVWDEANAQNLLAAGVRDEGPTHSTAAYDAVEDAVLITAIDPNTESWDHARWVYYLNNGSDIIAGRTYKFSITVKAAVATELHFRVGSTLNADPWIDNFTGGVSTVQIGTEYVTYQVIFTVDKTMPLGSGKFQFMYGYLPTDSTNTIYVKEFELVGEKQPIIDQVADLIPNNAFSGTAGNGIVKGTNASESAATITNIPAYTYDWMTGKLTYYFNTAVLTYGQTYRFAIRMKATTETVVKFWIGTGLSADPWLDTFSNTKGVALTATTSYTTQYVYFTVDKTSFDASNPAKFEFTIGYGNDAANTLYVSDFVIEHYIPAGDSVDITSFDNPGTVNAGTAAAPLFADAAAVAAALPTSVTCYHGQLTVPVASWVDTDTFNPAVPGYYTFTAVLGALPDGVTNTGNLSPTIEVMVHMNAPQVTVNDFEAYADNAAYQADTTDNIVGTRVGSGTFVKASGTLVDVEGNAMIMSDMVYGTNGIRIKVNPATLPATAKYIAVWLKVSSATGLTSIRSFCYYASTYAEVTTSIIADFADLARGTYVYIPVSALNPATYELSVVVYAEGTPDGDLYVDNILYCEETIPNATPVAAISDASLALLSGMTLKAGESIESLLGGLLAMITVNDAEDGAITPTAGMLSLGALNPAAPVMGSYTVTFTAVDSDGASSNVITLPLSIVTVIQDWNSYADDAAFKAAPSAESRLFGFRTYTTTTNPSMLPASGSLVVDNVNANNYLQVVYGYNTTNWKGMNGMQVYVSKDELVAAGATYVGIRLTMEGTVVSGSALQFYDYTTDYTQYQQRTAYGNIAYVQSGTYVWIKVSELRAGVTMLSFQVNVKNGSAGTMYFDNLVMK